MRSGAAINISAGVTDFFQKVSVVAGDWTFLIREDASPNPERIPQLSPGLRRFLFLRR
jgi:hypothetical protein